MSVTNFFLEFATFAFVLPFAFVVVDSNTPHYLLKMSHDKQHSRTIQTCPSCHFPFANISHHFRFSPSCAPCPFSMKAGDTYSESSSGSVNSMSQITPSAPDDLVDPDISPANLIAARLRSGLVPINPSKATFDPVDDMNDEDMEYIFHTEMNFSTPSSYSQLPSSVLASMQMNTTQMATTSTESIPTLLPAAAAHVEEDLRTLESGRVFRVPPDYEKGQYCFTKTDRSMMRFYNICDQAGSPRYLMDKVLGQMRIEMSKNGFDPLLSSVTKRDAYMARMHRKFPSPPPEQIMVQLESFSDPVALYRFNAIEQLQKHLSRQDLYGDVSKLNVNQEHPFDQSYPVPTSASREITDGTWYPEAVAYYLLGERAGAIPDDLDVPPHDEDAIHDQYDKFLLILEEYKDSTGNDQKESYSLEPVVLSTGLLNSSFNGDHRSRFIIGYLPNLSNFKSSASQSRYSGTQKGYGSGVRDYHKMLSIILQPLVEAQSSPPLLDIRLGNQVCRRCITLLMGTLLGDGKSHNMSCDRVGAYTKTFCLS